MKKLLLSLTVLVSLTLTSCGTNEQEPVEEETVELTELTFNGVSDTVVNKNSMFNILEGITVTGNDDNDYTDTIKVYLKGCGVDPNNDLYTYETATCYIEYIAVVDGIYVKESRVVTIR